MGKANKKPVQASAAVLSQRWLRNVSYIDLWVPWKFRRTTWLRPRLLFPTFYGLLFPWYRPKKRWWVPIGAPCIYYSSQHSVVQNCSFEWGCELVNPQSCGRGGRRGSGWNRSNFERALVSFYRPSIVTFPLPIRISEILPLLFSSTSPLFPYPTSSLPQIFPCFTGIRWIAFSLQRAKAFLIGLVVCAISFQDFQPMWSQSTNVADRRTDGQTDDMRSQDRAFALKCIAR